MVIWIFDYKRVDTPNLPVVQGSTMFFTSPAGKRKTRKQRSEYFALDHTASECDCGHHTSTTSLQCLGVMNETVVFNGKVSIPFHLSLRLFFCLFVFLSGFLV